MLEKIKNMFKKNEPVVKTNNEKELATKKKEPWVSVLTTHVDKTNPRNGFFELDWNEYFVQSLRLNGYRGDTDEMVVDKWFQDLCLNVAKESNQVEELGGSGHVSRVVRDDGKTEVS